MPPSCRYCLIARASRIGELAAKAERIVETKFDASVERIAEEICRIVFCDPADLFDQDGRLRQIKDLPPHVRAAVASVETVRGGGIKVKLWNKNNALDSLGRWRRMFVELQELASRVSSITRPTKRCGPI